MDIDKGRGNSLCAPSLYATKKTKCKPIKDPKYVKFGTFTPLLLEEVSFDEKVLGRFQN